MTGLRRRLVPVAAVALLVTLTAACGVRPTGVITGGPAPPGPAQGVGLFFVAEHGVTLVLRSGTPPDSVDEALVLLLAGPDPTEQGQGYRTEIPAGAGLAGPSTAGPSGTTVRLDTDVTRWSATAVDQIACTVRYALPAGGAAEPADPVLLTGPDGRRGPVGCAVPRCPAEADGADRDLPEPVWCPPADAGLASPRATSSSGRPAAGPATQRTPTGGPAAARRRLIAGPPLRRRRLRHRWLRHRRGGR